jgi:hypothetical protein
VRVNDQTCMIGSSFVKRGKDIGVAAAQPAKKHQAIAKVVEDDRVIG